MNWFRNMKVTGKLAVGFGLMVLLTVAVGLQSLRVAKQINDIGQTNYEKHAVGMASLLKAELDMYTISRLGRDCILHPSAEEVDKRVAMIKEADDDFNKSMDEFTARIVTKGTREKVEAFRKHNTMMRAEQDKFIAMARDGRPDEALAYLATLSGVWQTAADAMAELRKDKMDLMRQGEEAAKKAYSGAVMMLVTAMVIAVLVAFGVALLITRIITSALKSLQRVTQEAATGDLTVRVGNLSNDELGQTGETLNIVLESLHGSMVQVAQSSQAVASAAGQLSAGSEQIASGAQEQASSLEETAASLEEITSTVKQNADNAQQANQLASGSREVAEKGGRVVSTAVEAMAEINRSSKKIADIITAIDEIAFQTNLLALNAAVEAARAGEQGRGFAVVAAEVRNLAQRSATAAKEIKTLIQDSVRKVEGGTELVNQSGQTLNEIVTSVKRVTDIVAEIAAASREQSAGIDQVNQAVSQMDRVTQSNAAQTEQLNVMAVGLATQARHLQSLVVRFGLRRTLAAAGQAVGETGPRPADPAPGREDLPERAAPAMPVGAGARGDVRAAAFEAY